MKKIVSVSLGPARDDYEFQTSFLGKTFQVSRVGVDGDIARAAELIRKFDWEADAISIGGVKLPYAIGHEKLVRRHAEKLERLAERVKTPVCTGDSLRNVAFEWALRHIEFEFGHYFDNARVLFLSGMTHYRIAKVMSEFTDNLTFADPVLESGVPKFLGSVEELALYAKTFRGLLKFIPGKSLTWPFPALKPVNAHLIKKAMRGAHIIAVPYYGFFRYLEKTSVEELGRKIVITTTAYDDRVAFLKERGVDVVIDTTPKILERVVGLSVLEALILTALEKSPSEIEDDDLLEIISEQKMDPRVVYPSGSPKRINRFAFVIHPLSQEYFKNVKPVEMFSGVAPSAFMDVVEKVAAYTPPFVYSKVTGIKSPQGVEAEGWLITVGGTPKEMLSRPPEFTYSRLLQAAKMAKKLGAQIMGLGAFTKVVGDAGATVARQADIPITTGNSYSASGALWAAADAVRRMGILKAEPGKVIRGKAMVMGATGSIGSVCCRLLAYAFEEVYMVGRNMAKLLALKESIAEENPDVELFISTRADKFTPEMDVIVTATSGAGKKVLDIARVKPGCVITDVARPLDLSPEDVAKRPDVMVIESGEIQLPGYPEMRNIGLPHGVAYACLAETIVLALEGRFENFTVGRNIEWQKVREIYKLGLKHGMKLAAISGVNGVFSDEDIARIRKMALAAG